MSAIFLKPSGRAYYLAFFALFMLFSLLLVFVSNYFALAFNIYQVIVGLMVVYFIASSAIFLYYQCQYIHVEENFITVRQGVISSKVSVVPMSKIVEVAASYSILDRILGIGTIKVDTSGTNTVEIIFRFVPKESIHTFISIFKTKKAEESPAVKVTAESHPPSKAKGEEEDKRDSW